MWSYFLNIKYESAFIYTFTNQVSFDWVAYHLIDSMFY